MKKSNLLLIAALVILLVSLGMYNAALKKEYLTESYKDPFRNYQPMPIKDFQALEIKASHPLRVSIRPGASKVWVQEEYKDIIKVKQTGHRLKIETAFPEKEKNRGLVIITCPDLSAIHLDAKYAETLNTKDVTGQTFFLEDLGQVSLEGFTLDSLQTSQDHASVIWLGNNKIGKLQSTTGLSPGARSKLEILPGNNIREADLTVKNKGKLVVKSGTTIGKLRYDFGDNTEVTFAGEAMSLLKK